MNNVRTIANETASDSPLEVRKTFVQSKHAFAQPRVVAQRLKNLVRPACSVRRDGGGALDGDASNPGSSSVVTLRDIFLQRCRSARKDLLWWPLSAASNFSLRGSGGHVRGNPQTRDSKHTSQGQA